MPNNPFAHLQMSIDGGGYVSGGQIALGGSLVQLRGEDTTDWGGDPPLWEIYAYPKGFALPAGWTNVNGVYRSSDTVPPSFNVDKVANWGKYLFRLTVRNGLLDGVYHGPTDAQPLVDISGALIVLSPSGAHDVAPGESNQYDAFEQWVGELRQTLRALEGFYPLTTPDDTPTRFRRTPVADGDVRCVRYLVKAQSSDASGGVRGEWEVKGCYGRVAGVLAAEYAPTITTNFSVGGAGAPTITLNGNTDVDLNVTGVAATQIDWSLYEMKL